MSGADATLRMILLGEDRSASKAVTGVGAAAEKSSGKLHSFGKVAAGVFAGGALLEGAQKAAEFLKGATEAAVQDQQNNAILERQLKNTTNATNDQIKATEEWVTKTAEASGTAKSDITPALTKLATVTGSVTKAQKLTTLAMNVSAGTGKSLTSVIGAFVKAQNGSVGGLSRMGVATQKTAKDNAALERANIGVKTAQLAYNSAVSQYGAHSAQAKIAADKLTYAHEQVGEAMQKTKKTTLSFTQIQKKMADQFKGDTAASADTAAGRMKRLSVTWEEMKVQIGDKLIPILSTLASFMLDKVLPAVSRIAGFLSAKLGPIFGQVAGQVTSMHGSISTNLHAVEDTFSGVVSIVRSLWKRFGSFILDYIVATLKNVWQAVGGALKIIEGIVKVFSSLLHGDWKGVWQGVKLILAGALQLIKALISQSLNIIKTLWKIGWSALTGILKGVWDGIKSLARSSAAGLVDLIRGIPGDIKNLGGLFLSAGKSLIGKLFDGIVAAARGGMGFVSNLIGAIKSSINSALHLPLSVNFDKGPLHIHATVIPALAKGGIVSRPTVALIGEAGPEAVVPLSGPNARGFGGDGVSITVNGALDPNAVAKQVQTILLQYKRTRGGLDLGLA